MELTDQKTTMQWSVEEHFERREQFSEKALSLRRTLVHMKSQEKVSMSGEK